MNATTVATPGPFAGTRPGTRGRPATTWALVGAAGTVLVGAGALFWAQSQTAPEVVVIPQVATVVSSGAADYSDAIGATWNSDYVLTREQANSLADRRNGARALDPRAVNSADLVAHGGAGRALTGSSPIVPAAASAAVADAGTELIAHGGGGSVWTVTGAQLKRR